MAGRQALEAHQPEPVADIVPEQCAEDGTNGASQDHHHQAQLTAGSGESGQRHDELGGYRREHVFQQHQERDAEVAGLRHHAGDPVKHPISFVAQERDQLG